MSENIAVIGESMLEVSCLPSAANQKQPPNALPASLSYGGDTLNTSIYMARLGIKVDYVTALGDDDMSDWMLEQWQSEGVGCHLVQRQPESVPGLYMIKVDDHGERSFMYWRKHSPATRLFEDPANADRLFSLLSSFSSIYLSGISLAIYSKSALDLLFSFLSEYRRIGGKVFFDGNYRPTLWDSRQQAIETYEKIYSLTDIALPTIEDEQMVFGNDTPTTIVDRIQSHGVKEVVLKMGSKGCLVSSENVVDLVESNKVSVVDTTSAGDSFNAGYLAHRMQGGDATSAAVCGHKLASVVIQHRGAIIPVDSMP